MLDPRRRFYHDLTPAEQDRWVAELRPVPVATQMTPIHYAAYRHYPVTYLFCENDQALMLEGQKAMVQQTGVHFRTESCTSSHSPFLGQPETVLHVVERMLEAEIAGKREAK